MSEVVRVVMLSARAKCAPLSRRWGAGVFVGHYDAGMGLLFDTRASNSSWISAVWTCASEDVTTMTAVASETWGLVFWREDGRPQAAIVGPDTHTSVAPVPPEASFVGIQVSVGASLRIVDTSSLVDGGVALPDVTPGSFWLDGQRWETPGADDAELLVERLVQHDVLLRDPVVTGLLRGDRSVLSQRPYQ